MRPEHPSVHHSAGLWPFRLAGCLPRHARERRFRNGQTQDCQGLYSATEEGEDQKGQRTGDQRAPGCLRVWLGDRDGPLPPPQDGEEGIPIQGSLREKHPE